MDRLESLGNQLSQITMYDIKSMYNQAKNMVLNVSEMEAKVREATNDDPWGASSSLMQEIAAGTFNFQQFNEIMPSIYSRFMEKEARQWREIYKALQLLEYIIKHGSERVVDDARAHLHTIKMLRNFHYIDDKGKDQGINVRNRAKEIAELLSDVDRIRAERRKAKANRNKYVGTGNDGFDFEGGSRYGGFGNDISSYSGASGSYGASNVQERNYGRGSSSGFRDNSGGRRGFDEYDAGDDEAPRRSSMSTPVNRPPTIRQPSRANTITEAALKQEEPKKTQEADLLGFADEEIVASPTTSTHNPQQVHQLDVADDDFADFQTAAPLAPVIPQTTKAPNLMDMLSSPLSQNMTSSAMATQNSGLVKSGIMGALSPSARPSAMQSSPMYSGAPVLQPTSTAARPAISSSNSSASVVNTTATTNQVQKVNFDDLWSMSLNSGGGKGSTPSTPAATTAGKSIKDLEREKAQASMWGSGMNNRYNLGGVGITSSAAPKATENAPASTSADDDLLL